LQAIFESGHQQICLNSGRHTINKKKEKKKKEVAGFGWGETVDNLNDIQNRKRRKRMWPWG
jgi:hypothetical protein